MGFIPVAIFRYHMAVSNAKRYVAMEVVGHQQEDSSTQGEAPTTIPAKQSDRESAVTEEATSQAEVAQSRPTTPAPAPVQTVLRESFVTAGSVVAGATVFVGLAEIALLVLILRI